MKPHLVLLHGRWCVLHTRGHVESVRYFRRFRSACAYARVLYRPTSS